MAYQAIQGALRHLGLADVPAPAPFTGLATGLKDVVLRESPDDRLARDWRSFDPIRAGELIGVRADGTQVLAPYSGCVLFPYPEAEVGGEWFYLAAPQA